MPLSIRYTRGAISAHRAHQSKPDGVPPLACRWVLTDGPTRAGALVSGAARCCRHPRNQPARAPGGWLRFPRGHGDQVRVPVARRLCERHEPRFEFLGHQVLPSDCSDPEEGVLLSASRACRQMPCRWSAKTRWRRWSHWGRRRRRATERPPARTPSLASYASSRTCRRMAWTRRFSAPWINQVGRELPDRAMCSSMLTEGICPTPPFNSTIGRSSFSSRKN